MSRGSLLIALLFASTIPCNAAIALVNKTISDSTCNTTVPSTTAGNLLAVFCETQNGTVASAVSDNASGGSNSYTEVIGSRGGFSGGIASTNIFYSQTTHGSATTVSCTSGSGCYGMAVYEYSGALASGNPVDTSSGSIAVGCIGTSCSGAPVTTTNTGDVIFTGAIPGNSITAVAAPYGNFLGGTGNGQASCDYLPGTTVTASQAVWTSSVPGDALGSSVVAFLPASGAASVVPQSMFQVFP